MNTEEKNERVKSQEKFSEKIRTCKNLPFSSFTSKVASRKDEKEENAPIYSRA